jgi:hypothetical protein
VSAHKVTEFPLVAAVVVQVRVRVHNVLVVQAVAVLQQTQVSQVMT